MSEIKRRTGAAAPKVEPSRDATQNFDDVTVLFAPPPELLEQTARDDGVTGIHAHGRGWVADDEATLAVGSSFLLSALEPVQSSKAHQAVPLPHALQPAPVAPPALAARPPFSRPPPLEIDQAELGAMLGPRRAARWLALGGALALLLVWLLVARFAP